MNFYNDNDPKACAWIRELIADGHLPAGTVDERSILEIKPADLDGFDQCHFFAGVGFWSLALQWAGLGDTPGIWTGSCPCQPWSCAGAGKGHADERHLWPAFRDLILAGRPAVVFGEQVASAAVVGKVGRGAEKPVVPVWLDGVRADMEEAGYAFGAAVLGAHSVGAPHIRQRCYWVADAHGGGWGGRCEGDPAGLRGEVQTEGPGGACGASHTGRAPGLSEHRNAQGERSYCQASDAAGIGARITAGGTSDMQREGLEGHAGNGADGDQPGRDAALPVGHAAESVGAGRSRDPARDDQQRDRESGAGMRREESAGRPMPWGEYRVHRYLDGKDRRIPTEPRLFPLADDRHPWHRGRVGLLRGAGNGILPALAAEFIGAWLDVSIHEDVLK